jgi:Fic family protein
VSIFIRFIDIVVIEQPYCRISNLVEAGIAKRQTASEYLPRLADIGILTPIQAGREKLFIRRPLLDVLASEPKQRAGS